MNILLLVSDSPRKRAALRECAPKGFLCVEAPGGKIGVSMAYDLLPDVVVVDAALLYPPAEALCRRLHEDFPWMRFLLLGGEGATDAPCTPMHLPITPHAFEALISRAQAQAQAHKREKYLLFSALEERAVPLEKEALRSRVPGKKAALVRFDVPEASLGACENLLCLSVRNKDVRRHATPVRIGEALGMIVSGNDDAAIDEAAYRCAYSCFCAMRHYLNTEPRLGIGPVLPVDELTAENLRPIAPASGMRNGGRMLNLAEELLCTAADAEALCAVCAPYCIDSEDYEAAAKAVLRQAASLDFARAPGEDDVAMLRRAISLRDAHAPKFASAYVNAFRSFIANRLDNPLMNLRDYAEESGHAVSRARMVFGSVMGMTVSQYILELKIACAARMLARSKKRAGTIADALGLPAPYLNGIFRVRMGCTPVEYRKSRFFP